MHACAFVFFQFVRRLMRRKTTVFVSPRKAENINNDAQTRGFPLGSLVEVTWHSWANSQFDGEN